MAQVTAEEARRIALRAVEALSLPASDSGLPTMTLHADFMSSTFRIEARTSDPVAPAVGQIWLRTDL